MTHVQILPPAAKFLKKLKDKKLKSLYKEAIEMICEDYSIGEEKTGDLAGTRENFYEELKRYIRTI
nr:type II toxin-antitoxin system RelE/ParE family toxin [uncultured Blautia sp.]